MPTIKMDEIVQLTVTNMDDPDPNSARVLGITVRPDMWTLAEPITKKMIWRGLIAEATDTWAAQDAEAAAKAEQDAIAANQAAPVDEPGPALIDGGANLDLPAWNATAAEHPALDRPADPDATAIIDKVVAE